MDIFYRVGRTDDGKLAIENDDGAVIASSDDHDRATPGEFWGWVTAQILQYDGQMVSGYGPVDIVASMSDAIGTLEYEIRKFRTAYELDES